MVWKAGLSYAVYTGRKLPQQNSKWTNEQNNTTLLSGEKQLYSHLSQWLEVPQVHLEYVAKADYYTYVYNKTDLKSVILYARWHCSIGCEKGRCIPIIFCSEDKKCVWYLYVLKDVNYIIEHM